MGTALTSMTAHLPSYAISRSSSAYSSVMGLQLCAGSSRGAAAAARSGTDLGDKITRGLCKSWGHDYSSC